MSKAWEMTVEDVFNALDSNKNIISEEFMQSYGLTANDIEDAAECAHNAIHHRANEVEKAALYGNSLHEQTVYAHNAIVSILIEEGILVNPNLTYRQLKQWIESFDDKQLDANISVFNSAIGEFLPVNNLSFTVENDVLDDNHPIIIVNQ